MSGVYVRNRNLSTFEYFNTAVSIRNEVTRLVTSGAVPKSYRFIFAVPMAETARSVVFNLVKADAFYPNTQRNVEERKHYMTLALADLNQLYMGGSSSSACNVNSNGNANNNAPTNDWVRPLP